MKVALLQIRLDPASRAANTQRLVRAIDDAARTAPAPDLLVLPGGCDTGGSIAIRRSDHVGIASVRETLAWKTREWGLFVAAGLHAHRGDRWVSCAVLFDPDGDIVAMSAPSCDGKDRSDDQSIAVWRSSIGAVGVLEPALAGTGANSVTVPAEGMIIAVPLASSTSSKRRRTALGGLGPASEGLANGGSAFWAQVCPAALSGISDDRTEKVSSLCGPDGVEIARAEGSREAVVYAEIPI